MLFLLRMPWGLLWVLLYVLMGVVWFGLPFVIGIEKCWLYTPILKWGSVFLAIALLTKLTIVDDLIIPRCVKKWRGAGLRYAKHARNGGLANHAEKAAKCFLKGAIFKDGDSIINLGLCYAEGFGVKKDLAKAASCYKIAATRLGAGGISRIALGFCYAYGLGIEKDMVKSEDLYKKANDRSFADYYKKSLSRLRQIKYWKPSYAEDWNPTEEYWNPRAVITWMQNAAECGNASIQVALGWCYERGVGVAADQVEAVQWFRKAAEQGDAKAQWCLGRCYESGDGVIQDKDEAAKWYRMAADQGHRYAIEELEELKKNGLQIGESQYN